MYVEGAGGASQGADELLGPEAGSWPAIRYMIAGASRAAFSGHLRQAFWWTLGILDEILHRFDDVPPLRDSEWRYRFCSWVHDQII